MSLFVSQILLSMASLKKRVSHALHHRCGTGSRNFRPEVIVGIYLLSKHPNSLIASVISGCRRGLAYSQARIAILQCGIDPPPPLPLHRLRSVLRYPRMPWWPEQTRPRRVPVGTPRPDALRPLCVLRVNHPFVQQPHS